MQAFIFKASESDSSSPLSFTASLTSDLLLPYGCCAVALLRVTRKRSCTFGMINRGRLELATSQILEPWFCLNCTHPDSSDQLLTSLTHAVLLNWLLEV